MLIALRHKCSLITGSDTGFIPVSALFELRFGFDRINRSCPIRRAEREGLLLAIAMDHNGCFATRLDIRSGVEDIRDRSSPAPIKSDQHIAQFESSPSGRGPAIDLNDRHTG